MEVTFRVREQLVAGREYVYRNRTEFNFKVLDIDVPGDSLRAAREILGKALPTDYEIMATSLEDRTHGVATIRVKRQTKAVQAQTAPGRIIRPVARGAKR